MAQRFLTRRIYLDNIRWITVCIVVIYHVIYIFNGVQPFVRSDGTKDHKVLQRRTWKNKEPGRKVRMDFLTKTLEFTSRW